MARTGQNGQNGSDWVRTGQNGSRHSKNLSFPRANAQGGMCLCAWFDLCVFESLGRTDR